MVQTGLVAQGLFVSGSRVESTRNQQVHDLSVSPRTRLGVAECEPNLILHGTVHIQIFEHRAFD